MLSIHLGDYPGSIYDTETYLGTRTWIPGSRTLWQRR